MTTCTKNPIGSNALWDGPDLIYSLVCPPPPDPIFWPTSKLLIYLIYFFNFLSFFFKFMTKLAVFSCQNLMIAVNLFTLMCTNYNCTNYSTVLTSCVWYITVDHAPGRFSSYHCWNHWSILCLNSKKERERGGKKNPSAHSPPFSNLVWKANKHFFVALWSLHVSMVDCAIVLLFIVWMLKPHALSVFYVGRKRRMNERRHKEEQKSWYLVPISNLGPLAAQRQAGPQDASHWGLKFSLLLTKKL